MILEAIVRLTIYAVMAFILLAFLGAFVNEFGGNPAIPGIVSDISLASYNTLMGIFKPIMPLR